MVVKLDPLGFPPVILLLAAAPLRLPRDYPYLPLRSRVPARYAHNRQHQCTPAGVPHGAIGYVPIHTQRRKPQDRTMVLSCIAPSCCTLSRPPADTAVMACSPLGVVHPWRKGLGHVVPVDGVPQRELHGHQFGPAGQEG